MRNPASSSRFPSILLSLASLAMALGLGGCAAEDGGEDVDSTEDGVIGGTITNEQSAVGKLGIERVGSCTGTLIGPRHVLTAAHCVAYESGSTARRTVHFELDSPEGTPAKFVGKSFLSLGTSPGADDVAIVELEKSVPSRIAKPMKLARDLPANGERITLYGYGCTDRDSHDGSGTKRKAAFDWTNDARDSGAVTMSALCPGDSGGPAIDSSGRIVGVNSGFGGSKDYFGLVQRHFLVLRGAIEGERSTDACIVRDGDRELRMTIAKTSPGQFKVYFEGVAGTTKNDATVRLFRPSGSVGKLQTDDNIHDRTWTEPRLWAREPVSTVVGPGYVMIVEGHFDVPLRGDPSCSAAISW